ncbi:Lysophospholipase L1 [Evansella caseinilytica]|uniref:Lysophospholipase L1 n=1 Tax=Evansella caseinilytica TaxID=1503961 RepID=A0A1H3R2F1_9BACI|nr:GDSL-type esterase/lipase family protein [Evansella caseinilytica]SDZ19776.1 Lysophospholipase L1 [Evansella caseinilytica]
MRPAIVYTALGDSLTLGSGALLSKGFVERYTDILRQTFHRPVVTHVHAQRRITSGQLLHMISNPFVRQDIYQADIMTITIGGNDLLQANRRFLRTNDQAEFENAYYMYCGNLKKILDEIRMIKQKRHSTYIIQLIGLYNPYPSLSYSDYWVCRFNQAMQSMAGNGILYVDTFTVMTGGGKNVLSFGIHPNGNGYQLFASQLAHSLRTTPAAKQWYYS